MTLCEASEKYRVSMEKLLFYESSGLLECEKGADGTADYTESELKKAGVIHVLQKAGMDVSSIRQYLFFQKDGAEHRTETVRLLRKQHCQLLEEIHARQQTLDELDYMIDMIRKEAV